MSYFQFKRDLRIRRIGSFESLEDRRLLTTYIVSNSDDDGNGSLRQAILLANANPGKDAIHFDIVAPAKTIELLSELPWITDPVELDATTQPGYAGKPLIGLSGATAASNGNGLSLDSINSSIRGLAISGFSVSAIDVRGDGYHVIEANWLGLGLDGNAAVANSRFGIHIVSANNRIGGAVGLGNVISGNTEDGVRLWGDNARHNKVFGNFIGTAIAGDAASANGMNGVLIANAASNNTIGTDSDGINDALESNVISGNEHSGVRIFGGNSNHVAGNLIGVTRDGASKLTNGHNGVLIDGTSTSNVVGVAGNATASTLQRNVISGNARNGVFLFDGHRNVVAGNLIGLAADGSTPIGNQERGVLISGSSTENLVGTNDDAMADALERNIVAGNVLQGVYLSGSGTARNRLAGNFIGTDSTGANAVPNLAAGVLVANEAQENLIGVSISGTATSSAGNLISGNTGFGIRFRGVGTSNNAVAGNLIGVNSAGNAAIPNLLGGISSSDGAIANQIGGTRPQDANLISGNGCHGIIIQAASGSNTIVGNRIGLAADGITPLGNELDGIKIDNASNNSIGNGSIAGQNWIAHNGRSGIAVDGIADGNVFSVNSIYANLALGIDLGTDGATPNDIGDMDSGPNQLLNSPTILQAASNSVQVQLAGSFTSTPSTDFRFEFFASSSQLQSTGQGKVFIGSLETSTDPDGQVSWWVEFPASVTLSDTITATATSSGPGTSEFSAAHSVTSMLIFGPTSSLISEGQSLVLSFDKGESFSGEEVFIALASNHAAQLGLPPSITIPADSSTAQITLTAVDDAIAEREQRIVLFATVPGFNMLPAATGAVTVTIAASDLGWHNFDNPLDVNANGSVSPTDVLLIINAINAGVASVIGRSPADPVEYLDVNNDSQVTALDVLLTINFINASAAGEGEIALPFGQDTIHWDEGLIDWLAHESVIRRRSFWR